MNEIEGLPKFRRSTMWKILKLMGFKFSRHSKESDSLLSTKDGLVEWRKKYLSAIPKSPIRGHFNLLPWWELLSSVPLCGKKKNYRQTWTLTVGISCRNERGKTQQLIQQKNAASRGLSTGIKTPASMRGKLTFEINISSHNVLFLKVNELFSFIVAMKLGLFLMSVGRTLLVRKTLSTVRILRLF